MIQLRSVVIPADNTGAKLLRVIHVHGGSKRKYGTLADIISASVIAADPQGQIKKGDKVKAVVIRVVKQSRRADGSYIRFDDNAVVIIDSEKTKEPRGTRVFGPIAREVKEAGFMRIASLASEVV